MLTKRSMLARRRFRQAEASLKLLLYAIHSICLCGNFSKRPAIRYAVAWLRKSALKKATRITESSRRANNLLGGNGLYVEKSLFQVAVVTFKCWHCGISDANTVKQALKVGVLSKGLLSVFESNSSRAFSGDHRKFFRQRSTTVINKLDCWTFILVNAVAASSKKSRSKTSGSTVSSNVQASVCAG